VEGGSVRVSCGHYKQGLGGKTWKDYPMKEIIVFLLIDLLFYSMT
jgi:hypothetical protein